MDFTKKKKENGMNRIEEVNSSANVSSESFLGKTIKIKGNITSEDSIIIEGKVNGNIQSKNTITIGNSGNTTGKIEAEFINIIGKAKGDIFTGKKLKIHSTAKFEGNINSENVVIEEGGIFNGNMNMSEKKSK